MKHTEKAHRIQSTLRWPGTDTFKHCIGNNLFLQCDLMVDDVDRGIYIWGPPKDLLKIKTINALKSPVMSKHMIVPALKKII